MELLFSSSLGELDVARGKVGLSPCSFPRFLFRLGHDWASSVCTFLLFLSHKVGSPLFQNPAELFFHNTRHPTWQPLPHRNFSGSGGDRILFVQCCHPVLIFGCSCCVGHSLHRLHCSIEGKMPPRPPLRSFALSNLGPETNIRHKRVSRIQLHPLDLN